MNCPHCQTPIDEHEASKCLDAWVAEKVMGWKVNTEDWHILKPHKEKEDVYWSVSLVAGDWGAWNPSTSIKDAWEVVEKMGSLDLNDAGHGWYCRLHPDPLFEFVLAPTAPLAICRAALKDPK